MLKILAKTLSILCVLVFFTGHLYADQNDSRLDGLFGELAKPNHTTSVYRMLEEEIWGIWGKAPKDEIQKIMDLGKQSLQIGMPQKALQQYTRVTKLAPNYAEGWNKLATVLYLLDRYGDAIVAVNKTLELEPRHFGALSGLGLIFEVYGEENGARAAYEKALRYNPYLGRIKSRLDYLESISDETDI